MATMTTVTIRAVFENRKAAEALAKAIRLTDEIAESQPWNSEAKEAAKAMRYVAKRVKVQVGNCGGAKVYK